MSDIITPFILSDLPAPVVAELQAVTSRIKDRLTRQVSDIIETGRDLIEVKAKLEHGQFASWLAQEFNMTDRTARRFMQAATWAEGKSDTVSVLTPTTIYLLSAPSTPEGVHEKVVERLGKGLSAAPEYIRHVVQDAKIREREAKHRKGKREAHAARKRQVVPLERERLKKEEKRQRIKVAAMAVAREVASILVNKLSGEEIDKVLEALKVFESLNDFNVPYMMLRGAIFDARQVHSDNVTVFPPNTTLRGLRLTWGIPKGAKL